MPGFVPGMHVFFLFRRNKDVDGRKSPAMTMDRFGIPAATNSRLAIFARFGP
jgi:hypothetical protein